MLMIDSSCTKKDIPVLTTTEASQISYNSAISGGDISNDGGAEIISKGINWNASDNPTEYGSKTDKSGGEGSFTCKLTDLKPNTSYYVTAFAKNSVVPAYGNKVTFTTSELPVPVVTTSEVTGITSSKACSGGNITDDRGLPITSRGVCWSTAPIPTIEYAKLMMVLISAYM